MTEEQYPLAPGEDKAGHLRDEFGTDSPDVTAAPHSLATIEARLAASTPGYWVAGIDIEPDDGAYWDGRDIIAVDELPVPDHSKSDAPEVREVEYERVSAWADEHCRGTVAETHNYSTIPDEQHDANQRLIANAKTDLVLLVEVAKAAKNFLECAFPGAGRYEAAHERLAAALKALDSAEAVS